MKQEVNGRLRINQGDARRSSEVGDQGEAGGPGEAGGVKVSLEVKDKEEVKLSMRSMWGRR